MPDPMPDSDLVPKTILVTGATGGIGLAAVRALVGRNATVLMVGHRPAHDRSILAAVREETPGARVEVYCADLAVQDEVRDLARQFSNDHPRLDVLINNVGGFFMRRELTPDGIERTWALNHLNTFLLTWCLRDLLEAGAPARVINVSSDAHRGRNLDWDDLQGGRRYGGYLAYGQSKVAMNMLTFALARRWAGTGVTVNAVHPGFVDTGLYRYLPGLLRLLAKPLISLIAKSPQEGAEPLVHLALSDEVAGITGGYWTPAGQVRASPVCYDQGAQERLWTQTMEMLGEMDEASA